MIKLHTLLSFLLALVGTRAFIVLSASQHRLTAVYYKKQLNPVDLMCIENVADYCLHEECDVQDKEAVINQLRDQGDIMKAKVVELDALVAKLETSAYHDKKEHDIKSLLSSIEHVLSIDTEETAFASHPGVFTKY